MGRDTELTVIHLSKTARSKDPRSISESQVETSPKAIRRISHLPGLPWSRIDSRSISLSTEVSHAVAVAHPSSAPHVTLLVAWLSRHTTLAASLPCALFIT